MNSSMKNQISQQFKNGGMSIKLLYINLGVYIVFSIIWIIIRLLKLDIASYNSLQNIFSFNSDILLSIIKPWTFITYSFIHGNIMHLFSNMLVLFFAGKMLEGFLGKKRILSIYIHFYQYPGSIKRIEYSQERTRFTLLILNQEILMRC